MKRSWWHVVKHVLFGLHSPSLLVVNRCWCQRKGIPETTMTKEEVAQCIERAYWRSWGGVR